MTPIETLTRFGFQGLEAKSLADKPEYAARLEHELSVIKELGFAPYFLVLRNIVKWAKENGVLVGPGRGSAAGSLLVYCLNITLVDPIKYDLIFERFLNPARTDSPPDIDVDFSDRDVVLNYIKETWGEDHVARVGSLNFLRSKSAIRDICRALGKPQAFANELAKLIPPPRQGLWESFEKEAEVEPRLLDKKYADVIEPTSALWGIARSFGTHTGGVVISPKPVRETLPLYKDKEGNPVTQFDYRDVERTGLLKYDILGVATLRVLQTALKYIRETGVALDIETLEDGDSKAYELICSGNLDGVFQLSGTAASLTVAWAPRNIKDLSVINALNRPGPMGQALDQTALRRRNGLEPVQYVHPALEPILKDTYGTIVFQEQIMKIATDLAGYSMAEGDFLRKIIGKKLHDKMEEEGRKLVSGMISNGLSEKEAKAIFADIESSGRYSFNIAHAVAYSFITYWCAYTKAHFPVEFYAALLSEESKPEKIIRYACDAKEDRIEILPPDINLSRAMHAPEGKSIRFGLAHIRGMSTVSAQEIEQEREVTNSPFTSISNLAERTTINAKAMECLGKAGALASVAGGINELEAAATGKEWLKYWRKFQQCEDKKLKILEREKENEQLRAKGLKCKSSLKDPIYPQEPYTQVIPLSGRETIELQRKMLNMYLSGHPLDAIRKTEGVTNIKDLENCRGQCAVIGVLQSIKQINTKQQKIMAIVRLEDRSGSIETMIFPSLYSLCKGILEEGQIYRATGDVEITVAEGSEDDTDFDTPQPVLVRLKPRKIERVEPPLEKTGWSILYPLLKGGVRVAPGSSNISRERVSAIIRSMARGGRH